MPNPGPTRICAAGGRRPVAALAGGLAALALLAGCSDIRRTAPDRTANEQLLISTAADNAVERLEFGVPEDAAVYLDTSFFESYDKKYVIGKVRTALAGQAGTLVRERSAATYVVEVRAGALSINNRTDYVGLGGFEMPVPTTSAVQLPQANLYENADRTGIAKLAATTFRRESGRMVHVAGPVYGLSWIDNNTVLGVGWRDSNVLPERLTEDMRPDGMKSTRTTPFDQVMP